MAQRVPQRPTEGHRDPQRLPEHHRPPQATTQPGKLNQSFSCFADKSDVLDFAF